MPNHIVTKTGEAVDLDRFDLTTRTRNCLVNERVSNLAQLKSLSATDILGWRNAGRKTLREIQELLGSLGLKLTGDLEPTGSLNIKRLQELSTSPTELAASPANALRLTDAAPEIQRRLVTRLKPFSLSTRARNILTISDITFLGELVQLSYSRLVKFKGSGKRTATELTRLVSAEGFRPGTTIPDWSDELVAILEVRFARQIKDDTVERSNFLLATFGPEPHYLEEELSRIATALESGRNLKLLKVLWGWDGADPRTLKLVSSEASPKLTRERVRQIEARALGKLKDFRFEVPYLKAALSLLRKEAPGLPSSLAARLHEEGIVKDRFSIGGVKVAAELLGFKWPLVEVSVGIERVLTTRDDEDRVTKLMQVIRRRTSEMGCINVLSLCSELQIKETRAENIKKIIDVLPSVHWLDEERTWLYLRGGVPKSPL